MGQLQQLERRIVGLCLVMGSLGLIGCALGQFLGAGPTITLEANVANCASVDATAMADTVTVLEHRLTAAGFAPATVRRQGACQISVGLPANADLQAAIEVMTITGSLEFIPMGRSPALIGAVIVTDCVQPAQVDCGAAVGAAGAPPANGTIYHTLMTGAGLSDVTVFQTTTGNWGVDFALTLAGSQIFKGYTSSHVGETLAIVLDKKVISIPAIYGAIADRGQINGSFTQATAQRLAVQLRYGVLPVPLKVSAAK